MNTPLSYEQIYRAIALAVRPAWEGKAAVISVEDFYKALGTDAVYVRPSTPDERESK